MESYGKRLHGKGMSQGSCFPACLLNDELKEDLYVTRVNVDNRTPTKNKHKIMDEDCLVVLSQECDIACGNDANDPMIELALFKPIEEKDLYPGNQYANSVRKIQLEIEKAWYQADIAHISWIKKESLWELLDSYKIKKGDESLSRTIAAWRGHRYDREPLPDNFNNAISPLLGEALKKIDRYEGDIRAIYISLDTYEEINDYIFDIFALTESSVEDDNFSEIMSLMEEFSYEIEGSTDFKVSEDCFFSVRDDFITVNELSNYRRLNLDYISLSSESDSALLPCAELEPHAEMSWITKKIMKLIYTVRTWLNI